MPVLYVWFLNWNPRLTGCFPKGSLPPGRLASSVTLGVMTEVEKIPDTEPKPGAVSMAPGDTNHVVHHLGPGWCDRVRAAGGLERPSQEETPVGEESGQRPVTAKTEIANRRGSEDTDTRKEGGAGAEAGKSSTVIL